MGDVGPEVKRFTTPAQSGSTESMLSWYMGCTSDTLLEKIEILALAWEAGIQG